MAKISIIIPIFNQEKYIERCLDSLLKQTLKDIEIICVDDGSYDNTFSILSEFSKKDLRIKIVKQINSGVSEARNIGVKSATGDFIGFVDPDDFVEENFYEKLYNAAIENNCDIACSSVIRENNKKKKVLIKYDKKQIAKTTKEKFELAHLPEHCYIWNKIYNRKKLLLSKITFRREMVYEDIIYSPDIIEALGDMIVVPDVWYHYWNNDKSIVKNVSDKCRFDKLVAKKYIIEKCFKYKVKIKNSDCLLAKREYSLLGIKILKVYVYRATKVYSLFGIAPVFIMKERI